MTKFVPRSITFTMPTKPGAGVQVTVIENDGNLDFIVDPNNAADLRGLFFNLNNESILGTTQTRVRKQATL